MVRLLPDRVFRSLDSVLDGGRESSRILRAALVRHAVCGGSAGRAARKAVRSRIAELIALVSDSSSVVRRHALVSLNIVMRLDITIISSHEDEVFRAIVRETNLDKSLIRTVNLGPFQYKEDDGLPLRKAAYECLITLISLLRGHVDVDAVVGCITRGLADNPDVRSLATTCILGMAAQPTAFERLASNVDALVSALRSVLSQKPKVNAVRQEVERHDDAVLACLHSIKALANVSEVAAQPSFVAFVQDFVLSNDQFAKLYLTLEADGSHGGILENARRAAAGRAGADETTMTDA